MVDLLVKILINAVAAVRRRQVPAREPAHRFNCGNDWWKLLVVALIFALVNSYIKPIVRRCRCRSALLTLGLFAFVINARCCCSSRSSRDSSKLGFKIGGFPPTFTSDAIVGALARRDRHQRRLDRREHRAQRRASVLRRCRRPTERPAAGDRRRVAPARAARRVRHAALRHRRGRRSPRPPRSSRAAFPDPWIRQYSVKANDVAAVVAAVRRGRGLGANVVSRGEWAVARRAGVPNDRITLEGVGKTDADLRAAVRAAADGRPAAWLAIESADEAEALAGPGSPRRARAGPAGRRSTSSSGSNPDVAPETHGGARRRRAAARSSG